MSVSGSEIYPFLIAITTGRVIKGGIHTRICLVENADKVVFHSRLVLHIEVRLAVHGFKLIA